jgi:hypothetical protein
MNQVESTLIDNPNSAGRKTIRIVVPADYDSKGRRIDVTDSVVS